MLRIKYFEPKGQSGLLIRLRPAHPKDMIFQTVSKVKQKIKKAWVPLQTNGEMIDQDPYAC